MNPQHPRDDKARAREEREQEIEQVRELLARTVRFLTRCSEDPKAALQSDDPRDLIRGLESLGVAPAVHEGPRPHSVDEATGAEGEVDDAPRSFPLRRRRSA